MATKTNSTNTTKPLVKNGTVAKKPSRLTFLIFSMVGVLNTAFDIALYVVLLGITGSILIANIASTSAALIFSYLINSRYTFKSKKWTAKSFIMFVAVTVFGLWVLQTGAIYAISPLLKTIPEHYWHLFGSIEATAKTLLPKLMATAITFIWNYLWYSKVIFKQDSQQTKLVAALDDL